jgi:hypothetical protein
MARVKVNTELGSPEITQITARPRGISAPVGHIAPSAATELARSLANIRPELSALLEDQAAEYRQAQENAGIDAFNALTYEEAKAKVDSGELRSTESPWFRAAFKKQFGLAYAADRRRQITTDYNNTFDKDNGNLDEFLGGYVAQDAEAYGNDPLIMAGLREGMQGVLPGIRDHQAQYVDGRLQERAGSQFTSIAAGAVDTAVEQGGDVGAAVAGLYAGHQATLGMTPQALDERTFALAEKYANEGNLAAVEGLLSVNASGLGAFTERAEYSTKAQQLIETAKAEAGKTYRVANTEARVALETRARNGQLDSGDRETLRVWQESGQITQDGVESLLLSNDNALTAAAGDAAKARIKSDAVTAATAAVMGGTGYAVQDVDMVNPITGETVHITRDDVIGQVVEEQMTALSGAGVRVQAATLAEFGVDANYKPWEDLLSHGYTGLSNALTQTDGKGVTTLPEPALNAYALYKEMGGQPNLRDRHIKDAKAAAIYRDAEILEQAGGMSAEDALLRSATMDRDRPQGLSTAIDRDLFKRAVDRSIGDSAANSGFAKSRVEEHARVLMMMGLPMERAVEQAKKAFDTSFTQVGNAYVNTRDHRIPPNFEEIASGTLDRFLAENPEVDLDDDEIALSPDREQNYWVITDFAGNIIPGANNRFHISDLQKTAPTFTKDNANSAVRANRRSIGESISDFFSP